MDQGERIEVRKIYIGKATLVGLSYGLVGGFILFILSFIILTVLSNSVNYLMTGFDITSASNRLLLSLIVWLASIILFALLFLIGSALYNLFSLMKVRVHLGLTEYSNEVSVDSASGVRQEKKPEKIQEIDENESEENKVKIKEDDGRKNDEIVYV